mgnify:CR=1 FL=1
MKVMFVNGSSHLHGTTMAAIEEMEKVFCAEAVSYTHLTLPTIA